ncbi:MAG: PQQ-binding-like beta-propeller repeat protein, partial [Planctomycetota bacterium]
IISFNFDKGKARNLAKGYANGQLGKVKPVKGKVGNAMRFTGKAGSRRRRRSHFVEYDWSEDAPPLFVRAMVLAGETLFLAGPPDFTDEDAIVRQLDTPEVQKRLSEQDAALAGEKGALLLAVAAEDGQVMARRKLPVPPAWDALVAANGKLYMATEDGRVWCLSGK